MNEQSLFDRSPSPEYIKEWTEALTKPAPAYTPADLSVLVFRLGGEWLALPLTYLKEVTHDRPFHSIPHRRNQILLGIVNLNGELQLYVALHKLLGIECCASMNQRMIAMVKENDLWVFSVDEIDGIYKWHSSTLENVPVNISKSMINYMKGIKRVDNKRIGLLNEELLFSTLSASALRDIL